MAIAGLAAIINLSHSFHRSVETSWTWYLATTDHALPSRNTYFGMCVCVNVAPTQSSPSDI